MKNASDQQRHGFSMVDLLLVIAAVVGIVCVILSGMARARTPRCRGSCVNNLKQVGIAFYSWELDYGPSLGAVFAATNEAAIDLKRRDLAQAVFTTMSNDLVSPRILYCPEDTQAGRISANVFFPSTAPVSDSASIQFSTNNLSYFLGLGADGNYPNRVLAGDDHFLVNQRKPQPGLLLLSTNSVVAWRNERHPKCGNVAMADASVHSFSSSGFQTQLMKTGFVTNRLAMP
jgi:hypothetical protein